MPPGTESGREGGASRCRVWEGECLWALSLGGWESLQVTSRSETHTHTHTYTVTFTQTHKSLLWEGVNVLVVLHEAVSVSDSCVTQVDITLPAKPLSIAAFLSVVWTIPAPTPDRSAVWTFYIP